MIVTTHQPIFLPWPGLFYKSLRADTVVLLDEVQFPLGRGWMNRNRLKSQHGELWLTVPVWKKRRGKQFICDVEICDETAWRRKHLLSLRQQYSHAPYTAEHLPAIEAIYGLDHRRLLDLNLDIIRYLASAIGIKTEIVLQSALGVSGRGTDLLVNICRALKADTYATLSPVAKYLDLARFGESGVDVRFAHFSPPIYPQLWGEFRYNVSALDLLLNCGPRALDILTRG
jgi:hypothetical protein